MEGPSATGEADAAVQAFIAARRADVLARAIESLRALEDGAAELDAVTHRLSGTLGSYALPEAQRVVERLREGSTDRATAIAGLTDIAVGLSGRERLR